MERVSGEMRECRITVESLAALERSEQWRQWMGTGERFTALEIYGPGGKLPYWGTVWDQPEEMGAALCDNMGGGVPLTVIDELVRLSASPSPREANRSCAFCGL